MVEATVFLIEEGLPPAGAPPASDSMQGGIKIDQHIGVCALPQMGDVRVLLRNSVGLETLFLEVAHEGRFARRANANHHNIASCDSRRLGRTYTVLETGTSVSIVVV